MRNEHRKGYGRASHWVVLGLLLILMAGCGQRRDPVGELIRDLDRYPEYSLMVDDLRVEDGFFPDHFLRFEVLRVSGERRAGGDTLVYERHQTDWLEVPESVFGQYEHYLGMVVASKTLDGRRTGTRQAHPPGYQYVGNPHYGHWGGGGFWQFYGQYAFMRSMLGGHNIGRADYGDFRRSHQRGQPYFGPVKGNQTTFGTRGIATQKARPNFYQRYKGRLSSGRGLSSRSRSRMGRTSSSWGRGYSRSGK